ncbi:helix-turn-helix transcriptional regulator [Streptomyces sp. NPDC047042]|uniref:helix-turn-helix domain-containing protein n=1 Tax=Streptomyces sp. NPDC047042 TaxID=3154807 RepID=UPI0033F2C91C
MSHENRSRTSRKKNYSAMRMLGKQLQAARNTAGYTQRALAEALLIDEETIASIEQGRRALMRDLAEEIDQLLDMKGALVAGVDALPEIDQFPLFADQYVAHEREAISLSWYDNALLPGILQTEPYALAVFRGRVPAFDEDEVATKTAIRMERHQIVQRRDPPTMSFVVWEPALHFPVGGAAVHREQLHHLRKCIELPRISMQFLPLDRITHAGVGGPFALMETPDHQHLAYLESHRGSEWVADPNWVSILQRKHAMLRAQALSPEDSLGLLDRLLEGR